MFSDEGETATRNGGREYVFNGKTLFSYVEEHWL